MTRARSCVAVAALLVGLAACGGSGTGSSSDMASGTSSAPTSPAAPTPAASAPGPSNEVTAADVVAKLKAGGVPVASTMKITAENDPNHLLGRPNGYTSKVVLVDSRVAAGDRGQPGDVSNGASVEVFADAASAKARAEYIGGIAKTSPALANEYDYVKGAVLVRVTGVLTSGQAAPYKAIVESLLA